MKEEDKGEKSVTAFNAIFNERIRKLVKDIKKFRKDPTKQDKFKQCLTEAKALKQSIKDSTKQKHKHIITVPYEVNEDGTLIIDLVEVYVSLGIKITNVNSEINLEGKKELSLNFIIKQQ